MSVDERHGHTIDPEDRIESARDRLDNRIGGPDVLDLPHQWTYTTAWRRAQTEGVAVAPNSDPTEHTIRLGDGDWHDVTFAIHDGDLVVGCDCYAYAENQYQGTWCPHVATLYLYWTARGQLVVVDLATGRTYLTPPAWLRIDEPRQLPARADGGDR